jgi:oxygen-independent coproporphyrinogen-3 oxidase
MENWIGAGPAASGTIIDEISDEISGEAPGKISGAVRGRRISYRSGVETFITHPAACIVVEELDRITLIKESLLMGFRYIEGPGAELFKRRFGLTLEEAIPGTLQKWRDTAADGSGNSGMRRGKTALTSEGLLFLNRFVRDAFAELDYLPSMSDSRRYV